MNTTWAVIGIGVLFVLKFVLGVWLTLAGKPYSGVLLTIHKLISLATAIVIGIVVIRLRRGVGMSTAEVAALVITEVLFVVAIVSGGLASANISITAAAVIVHRVSPFLAVVAAAVTMYLAIWAG